MDTWKILNRLYRKREAYQRLFLDQDGKLTRDAEIVLKDLRKYCRVSGTLTFTKEGKVDALAMANANGRREVYDRIIAYLFLEDKTEIQLQVSNEVNEDA